MKVEIVGMVAIVIGREKALSLYLPLDKSFYVEIVEADGSKARQDRCEDVVSHPLRFFCDDSRIDLWVLLNNPSHYCPLIRHSA